MHKILIVDDHKVITEVVYLRLRDEFEVFTANSVDEMQEHLKQQTISLVVMDIDLRSSRSGIDFLPEIKARNIPIIIYSGTWNNSGLRACLGAGVRAFVDKVDSCDVLSFAIRKVLSGEQYFPENVLTSLQAEDTSSPPPKDGLPEMRFQESSVLSCLCRFPDSSNAEIAHMISRSESLVKGYLNKLFRKFDVTTRYELVTVAQQRGFRP